MSTLLQGGLIATNKMDLTTLRVYLLNLSAITISTFDLIEDSLKIILLVISIAYTAQKWWQLKNKK